jgi:hypothetical protein
LFLFVKTHGSLEKLDFLVMAISAQTWIIQMLLFGDLKASQYIDEIPLFSCETSQNFSIQYGGQYFCVKPF